MKIIIKHNVGLIVLETGCYEELVVVDHFFTDRKFIESDFLRKHGTPGVVHR